jgi:hypothetical protein
MERMVVYDLAGVGWKVVAVIMEVEPPPVPLCVVGHHGARRIYADPFPLQCERKPAGANGPEPALATSCQREKLAPKEVEPQVS